MTKKLQHVFALSEKGAKDLVKAVIWCFVCNLSLMLPVGAVLFTAQHLLDVMETGGSPMEGFWIYTGSALAVLVLLFVLHWIQYASLYLATVSYTHLIPQACRQQPHRLRCFPH